MVGVTLVPEGMPGARPVTVTVLEMRDPASLLPGREPAEPVELTRAGADAAATSRDLYRLVGGPWLWVDRLGWTDDRWQDWVDQPGHELWLLHTPDGVAGYFELVPDGEGDVLLAYFGLVPGFEGRRLGGWLLTAALRRAWELPGTTRVWVHTCDLDSTAALPNYRARGLRQVRTWTEHRLVPPAADGTRDAPGTDSRPR
jgi:GNAT superfamily N-acetyltransferase